MNNLFLLNESLETASILDFEFGISNLNEIIEKHEPLRDNLLKHNSILNYKTKNGYVVEIVNSSSKSKLFWTIFRALKDHHEYINTEMLFDENFANQCNGFIGFNFTTTTISQNKQINNLTAFQSFINNCTQSYGQETFEEFWSNKSDIFKDLVFCDNVYDCIAHLSPEDNRFLLIKEKLTRLNDFTKNWKEGAFPHYEMGLNVSPDTQSRLKKSADTRIYICPDGDNREFSWHIKFSAGTAYRIYYYPDATTHKVIVGVIGTKPELGF